MSRFEVRYRILGPWTLVIAISCLSLSATAEGVQGSEPQTESATLDVPIEGDNQLTSSQSPPKEPADRVCQATDEPKVVQQGLDDPVVILDVGGQDSKNPTRQALSAKALGLSGEQQIARVFNPNARSPHFYALIDDGVHWTLRAYCKTPVFAVSEEALRSDEVPSVDQTVELHDWAFALRVSDERVLVWLKGGKAEDSGSWSRVSTGEPIATFTLGSAPEGVRVSFLSASGALGLQPLGALAPRMVPLGLGTIDARETVDLIDRGASVYVLTSAAGLVYRDGTLTSLYQESGNRDLVWRDSFFDAEGRTFGVLLLSRGGESYNPTYQGEVISLPEDGQPQRSQAIDLTAEVDAVVDEPRIFVRAEDRALLLLNACLVFKKGRAGESEGRIKPLRLSRSSLGGPWRVGSRGGEQICGSLDLDEIHVVGKSGNKDRIVHHLENQSGSHTCTCSL